MNKRIIFLIAFILAFTGISKATEKTGENRPNFLFIAIDDMNDWTGFLGGHPQARTPNMDKLANAGVNFVNAHCPAPGCSPSRNALLYGIEPFNSGLYPFYEHDLHNDLQKRYVSLPRFLKENGYETYGAGKIHHGLKDNDKEWTDYHVQGKTRKEFNPNKGYQVDNSKKMSFRPTINKFEEHVDYQVASYGIDVLNKKHDQPFFLAVGIVKPHLPFDCPEPFFDALPEHILPPAINKNDIDDIPAEGNSFRRVGDDRRFKKDKAWMDVRKAYLACISWADYNIGRLLDALENSPYAENTVVVLWSDHGYHLGEKMSFRKFTLWEEATRVPFIIYDKRQIAEEGRKCEYPVSLINIYRTLSEMAGLEVSEGVDGSSLVPQLMNPQLPTVAPSITSWGRGNYAVRSKDWRYIRYFDGTEELYSHENDRNEWHNLATLPEFQKKKKELSKYLPQNEAPTVKEYISVWSVVGADKAELKKK